MRLNELTRPRSLVQSIRDECKQILKLYASEPGRYLYRGSKRNVSMYKGVSQFERRPKDTDLTIHRNVVDAMINLGFTAHRGNSIFVTPSKHMARAFSSVVLGGQVYIIFPIDGFDYSWSPQVDDFYSDVIDSSDFAFGTNITPDPRHRPGPKNMHELLVNLDYKDTDLDRVIKFSRSVEVMIHGSYYAINSSYERQINAFIKGLK